jgi:hypothetical protein
MFSLQEDERTEGAAAVAESGASSGAKAEVASAFGVRERVFFAVLFAGIEDSLVAISMTWRTHVGPIRAVAAGLEAFAFLAFPLVVVGLPLGYLLSRPGARALQRHARIGLSGAQPENEGLASFLYAIVFAGGVAAAWRIGFRASDYQSARVATLVSTLASIVLFFGGALVVSSVVGALGPRLHRVAKRLPLPDWLPLESIGVAAVFVVTLYLLLPPSHAITPSAAVVGFALGPQVAERVPSLALAARLQVRVLAPIAFVLTLAAGAVLKSLPDSVQMGILARAPYGAIVITTVRRAFDRDHDGYSAILGGGDCDDRDAAIHPNALDVPENGVDENCSGRDSRVYTPPVQSPPRDMTVPPRRDNVVLIHIDALRPDHVSFAGYRRPTTPHLDRWREGATWFKNAYTPAPSTRFALSMIFTGLEIERVPQERGHAIDFTLLSDATTLAERLGSIG